MIHNMKSLIKPLGIIVFAGVMSVAVFYTSLVLWGNWHDEWSGYNANAYTSDGYCNIAVVPILGDIVSYGEYVDENGNPYTSTNMSDTLALLNMAEYDPYIAGVMVLIDSPGGTPVASELIANELKNSSIPVAAYIADVGASGAYLIATGADTIISSSFSDVGSIGITMSYLDYTKQNEAQGLEFVSLSSAKFKDYGAPDKPLTDEERALLERDLEIYHNEFVKRVAENRDMDILDVHKLADGSTMPGSLALEAGLIDELGNKETVRNWFAEQLDLPSDEVVFCR
jgi:protease-4